MTYRGLGKKNFCNLRKPEEVAKGFPHNQQLFNWLFSVPVGIYLFKDSNRNTRKRC